MARVARHRAPRGVPLELRLTGLDRAPETGSVHRMAAFDALPSKVQEMLAEAPFDFPAIKVLDYQRERGTAAVIGHLRRSTVVEVERFSRERYDALVWAQRTFSNAPAKKVLTKTLRLSFFDLAEAHARGENLEEYVAARLRKAGAADPTKALRFDDHETSHVLFTFTVIAVR
jgi:hypothetical protein